VRRLFSRRSRLGCVAALGFCLFVALTSDASQQSDEPFVYVGHGAFFGQDGRQIQLSVSFLENAQAWYRRELSASLSDPLKREFASLEKEWLDGIPAHSQQCLLARQRVLDWLVEHSPDRKNDTRFRSKMSALRAAVNRPLPQ
jgi:hypothetical protein